jgi:TPR repeat protein
VELNISDQLSFYPKSGTPLNLDPLGLSSKVAARPATQKQIETIKDLLKAIPEAKNTLEYQDYKDHQTIGNATELISRASELGLGYAVDYGKATNLVEYVGKRPGAVRVGEHGLFSSSPNVDIKKAQEEIANCKGNIWTHVISLRREDADMLGYNQQKPWRDLVMQKIDVIAKASNIPVSQLHWYAGMHNTTHHPHIHLFVFSDDPKAGHLTVNGINKMKSAFSEVIFADERHQIYVHKDEVRNEIKQQVDEILSGLSSTGNNHFSTNDLNDLCSKLTHLADDLKDKPGKKQYGWMLRDMDIRKQVNGIMSDLAKAPEIQKLYDLYCADHIALERMYREDPKDITPIVNNKEFRSIKNNIIREAIKLGNTSTGSRENEESAQTSDVPVVDYTVTDKNEQSDYEPDLPCPVNPDSFDNKDNFASLIDSIPPDQEPATPEDYPEPYVPDDKEPTPDEKVIETHHSGKKADFKEIHFNAVEKREPKAMYQLAKRYFYGDGVKQDYVAAQMWYGLAAEGGQSMAKYELGKMYLYGIGIDKDEKLGKEYCLEAYYDFTDELQESTGVNLEHDHFTLAELPNVSGYCSYLEYLVGRMRLAGEGVDVNYQYAFDWFRAASLHGHVHSEYMLAKMIYDGQGVPQSYADAAGYFAEAAEKGDKYASYAVGRMYYRGIGVAQDFAKAASFFTKAAEENVPYADYVLAQMAETGQGMERSAENASLLYKKALNEFTEQEKQQPDTFTEFRIAKMHLTGKGTEINPDEGAKWLEKAVGGGNVQAEYELAMMCASGEFIPKDEKKAAKLFEKALAAFISSDKDNPSAGQEYRIAQMYEKGLGTTVSFSEAVMWYSAAAENGHGHAAYRLGKFYTDGISIPQDNDAALKWFHRAAELKDKYAYFALGKAYFDGTGVNRNFIEAAEWFRKASDEGLPFSSYRLAEMYQHGIGLGSDAKKANEFYRKALSEFSESEKACPGAQLEYRIATMYQKGNGVNADPHNALEWLLKSADGGNAFAAYQAAQMLDEGKCVDKDEMNAANFYSDALTGFISLEADKQDAQMEYRIGSMYLTGKGTAANPQEALNWFLKSADGENAFATYQAAQILDEGKFVDKDKANAAKLYACALAGFITMEKGKPDAQLEYRIASMYLNGQGTRKNVQEAIHWFELSAKKGNSYAKYQLAELYWEGSKIPKDEAKARYLFADALKDFLQKGKDNPDAQLEYRIGSMFLAGKGTAKNAFQALHWFELSADKGNHYAEYQIAELYDNGKEIPKNKARAQIYYNRALNGFLNTEQNQPDASTEYRISQMFYMGQGTFKNYQAAWHWFSLSAAKDNTYALLQQARMLQKGEGVPKSEQRAQALYTEAFHKLMKVLHDDTSPQLRYRIGTMYEFGLGVERDVTTAKEWYRQAAQVGDENAANRLKQIEEFEQEQAVGSVMRLFRLFARALGHNVQDSTTHKYYTDRKLMHKQRMLHKQSQNQEQGM